MVLPRAKLHMVSHTYCSSIFFLNFLNRFLSNCVELFSIFIGLLHIAVGSSGSKCLHLSLQNRMLSYPDYWIWIIFNPESSPAGKLLSCLIYDFQCKWLSKENGEKSCCCSCMLQRGVEQSWNGPPNRSARENVSPRAEAWPRGAGSAAVTPWDLLWAVHCGAGKLAFLHKDLLPRCLVAVPNHFHSVRFLSMLGIVLGSHRHLREMWVDACLCSVCAACCSLLCSVKGMRVSMQVLDSGMLYYLLLNKKLRRKPDCSHQQLMGLPGLPYC